MILKNNTNKIKGFILLKGGRIYDPFLSINKVNDILIRNEKIVDIKKTISRKAAYKVIDCHNTKGLFARPVPVKFI